jgi:Cytochrome P460
LRFFAEAARQKEKPAESAGSRLGGHGDDCASPIPQTNGRLAQHDVDFMVKNSKRAAYSGGWGYGEFEYDATSPHGNETDSPQQTTPNADSDATQ